MEPCRSEGQTRGAQFLVERMFQQLARWGVSDRPARWPARCTCNSPAAPSVRAARDGARRCGFGQANRRTVRRICGRPGSRVRASGRWPPILVRAEDIFFRVPAAFQRWNKGRRASMRNAAPSGLGCPALCDAFLTPPPACWLRPASGAGLSFRKPLRLAGSLHLFAGGLGGAADAGDAQLELVRIGGSPARLHPA